MARWSIIIHLLLAVGSLGHTWLDCTKDIGAPTNKNTNEGDCRGFARGYPGRKPGVDIDRVMTYRILPSIMGQNPPICADNQRTANYPAGYYMATARPGETLRMRWTPNGHQRGAGQDPKTLAIHWTGTPGTQLQNRQDLNNANKLTGPVQFDADCFCNNCAGQPCYGSFTIPPNTRPGTYSFVWYWVFNRDPNGGGEEYTTCFDVAVQGNAVTNAPNPTTAARSTARPTTSPQTSSTPKPTNSPTNSPPPPQTSSSTETTKQSETLDTPSEVVSSGFKIFSLLVVLLVVCIFGL